MQEVEKPRGLRVAEKRKPQKGEVDLKASAPKAGDQSESEQMGDEARGFVSD